MSRPQSKTRSISSASSSSVSKSDRVTHPITPERQKLFRNAAENCDLNELLTLWNQIEDWHDVNNQTAAVFADEIVKAVKELDDDDDDGDDGGIGGDFKYAFAMAEFLVTITDDFADKTYQKQSHKKRAAMRYARMLNLKANLLYKQVETTSFSEDIDIKQVQDLIETCEILVRLLEKFEPNDERLGRSFLILCDEYLCISQDDSPDCTNLNKDEAFERAVKRGDDAIEFFSSKFQDSNQLSLSFLYRGACEGKRDSVKALQLLLKGLDMAKDPYSIAIAFNSLAVFHENDNNPEEAYNYWKKLYENGLNYYLVLRFFFLFLVMTIV